MPVRASATASLTELPSDRYVILTITQTLYSYFIEGDTIFVGKRKTFDKRVSTASYPLCVKMNPTDRS